ncbi:MAG: DUF981 family protein [Thermoplasmata archaeon]
MAFIDNLGFELGVLVLIPAIAFYMGLFVWWYRRKGDVVRAYANLRGGAITLGILGLFLSLLGFWGEFAWPLPGQYNVLFYDPTLFGGLILVTFAIVVHLRLPTQYLGVIAGITGLGVAYYGARGYQLGLTKEPLEMFLLFLGFGLTAAAAFPVTLFADRYVIEPATRAPSGNSPSPAPPFPRIWNLPILLFLVLAALTGIATILMGFNTLWSHLQYAP